MRPDALVLGFDTSAAHCAAALVSGDRVLAERSEGMATGQAERLMPMLEELLAGAGATWRALDAVGVGTGPGNFTGIRIAVAAARGLALGLGVPAAGVTGFEALAEGLAGPVVASLDGRRGQVYLSRLPDGAPVLADMEALPREIAGLPVVGHRAGEIASLAGGTALEPRLPAAVAIARIAARRLAAAAAAGVALPRPAPLYVRGPDAAPPREAPPVILPG